MENMIETLENMVNMPIDVLVGTEPDMASHFDGTLLIATAREYRFDVKPSIQNRDDPQRGSIVIMSRTQPQIPSAVRRYDPLDPNLKGRLMGIEFDNMRNGQHTKIQNIGAHLVYAAHMQLEDSKKLLT